MTPLSRLALIATTATLCTSAPAWAIPDLAVDGRLDDWNIVVADAGNSGPNPASDFTHAKVAAPGLLLASMTEDSDDRAGLGGYVGPYYGGQKYDAEFMGVAVSGNKVYIAIVTGIRPDNGFSYFGPGDLFIHADTGVTYAVEIGGGAGNSSGHAGAATAGADGSTYLLNNHGVTTGYRNAPTQQTAGSLWRDVSWINDPINDGTNVPVQFEINSQSHLLGLGEYIYTRDSYTGQHAVIEMAFDVSMFEGAHALDFAWGPTCSNDRLEVHDDLPEPGSLGLLAGGLGMLGLMGARRRALKR